MLYYTTVLPMLVQAGFTMPFNKVISPCSQSLHSFSITSHSITKSLCLLSERHFFTFCVLNVCFSCVVDRGIFQDHP